MKNHLQIFYSLTVLSLLVTNVYGAETTFHCKDKIRLASGNVVPDDVPDGYTPFISSSINRLTGVSVFDGPPEDGALLKPFSVTQKGAQIKWVFEGSYEKGKWFSCDYADGLIRLIQKIPEPASVCIATIRKIKPYNTIAGMISCKESN